MKSLKTILMMICNILLIPISCICIFSGIWYVMPTIRDTELSSVILTIIPEKYILTITIIALVLYVILHVLKILFRKDISVKLKNFFNHLISYIMCLTTMGLSVYTFAVTEPLIAKEIVIGLPNKISIGICLVALVLFCIFSDKLMKIINRRIQAYESAKEANLYGRGSIIFTNILKIFELFFPEVIVLVLMCSCLCWNISMYFVFILCSCIFPLIGNIICDYNIKADIKRIHNKENNDIAERVASKLKGGK